MKKNIHKQMVAAARPTIKKTPVTAPVLWKNWEVLPELSWARSVGGFAITSVKVWMSPLLKVEVYVDVTWRGANEVTCPRLLVV
jgi:hypothetical protein